MSQIGPYTSPTTYGISKQLLAEQLSFQPKVFAMPAFADLGMRVITGAKGRVPLQTIRRRQNMLKLDSGPGTPTASSGNRDIFYADLTRLVMFEQWGWDDLKATLSEVYISSGMTGMRGDLNEYITQLYQYRMASDLADNMMQLAWLGNVDSANSNYTQLNGWVRLIRQAIYDYSVTPSFLNTRVAPYTSSTALTASSAGALAGFQQCYQQAGAELKSVPVTEKFFLCSLAMYDYYSQSLQGMNNPLAWTWTQTTPTGETLTKSTLTYMGIPIYPISAYDRYVAADFSASGASYLPANFIMLAARDNMVIATDADSATGLPFDAAIDFRVEYAPYVRGTLITCEPAFGVQIANFQEISVVGFSGKNY